jgi:hypothetical protein
LYLENQAHLKAPKLTCATAESTLGSPAEVQSAVLGWENPEGPIPFWNAKQHCSKIGTEDRYELLAPRTRPFQTYLGAVLVIVPFTLPF